MKNVNSMLFDTHAHLNSLEFDSGLEEIAKRCQNKNIRVNNIGSDLKSSEKAVEIAEKYPNFMFAAIGLHPANTEAFDIVKYKNLAQNKKVVALGEVGLEYKKDKNGAILTSENQKEKQKAIFLEFINLSGKTKKPLVIHCRNSHDDLINILHSKISNLNSLTGVIHCFSGNAKQAKKYLEIGFLLGFTGIITYSSSYDKVIKETPLDKILIETDCPWLAPAPFRGQRNEPVYVKYVALRIAEIKNLNFETVAEKTFKNACELFKITQS